MTTFTYKAIPAGAGGAVVSGALDAPSAKQMGHLRKLIEARPFLTQRPDLSVLAFEQEFKPKTRVKSKAKLSTYRV